MIQPLKIGNKIFPNNLIQGPLAGVSCTPFRYLTWRYSQPAFTYTEMISCKTILHQSSIALKRFIDKHPNEGPVCFQLSSSNPDELAEATRKVTDFGADLVDLNCGCPVKKIRNKGAGSRLLTNPSMLYKLITAMKQNTHIPVSIKIRVQGNSEESFNKEIAQVISEAGADCLVVHGRHWSENYDVPCRYDDIQFFVNELNIPILGNGDINNLVQLKKMFATGCSGAMISRAGVGQPWLIAKLIAEDNNKPFTNPTPEQIASMLIEHVQGLISLMESEKHALFQARKLTKYYARSLPTKIPLLNLVNACETLSEYTAICQQFFIS